MTRTKRVLIKNITKDQANDAMHAFALSAAKEKQINARIEEQIVKIREKHKPDLQAAQEQKTKSFDTLQTYAVEHEELFEKKKSVDMTHGKIGFRTGQPKLKTKRGFTWGAVLELAKEKASNFVRQKEELDKERLLIERNEEGARELLESIKVQVIQEESFFAEPKEEEIGA